MLVAVNVVVAVPRTVPSKVPLEAVRESWYVPGPGNERGSTTCFSDVPAYPRL